MTTEISAPAAAPELPAAQAMPASAVPAPAVSAPIPASTGAKPVSAAVPRAMPVMRTRKQIAAAASVEQAEERARWKRALPTATSLWPKLDPAQLAGVHGNLNKLAGMIQLRYQTTREVADAQVAAFLVKTAA